MIGRTTPTERVRNYRGETYNGCVSPLPWAGLPPRVTPRQCRRTATGAATDSPKSATAGPTPSPSFFAGVSGSTPAVATTLRPYSTSAVARTAVARRLHGGVGLLRTTACAGDTAGSHEQDDREERRHRGRPGASPPARHSIARFDSGRLRLLPIIDGHRSEEQRARPRRGMPSVGVTEFRRSPCDPRCRRPRR